jgi:positive regulator of sigma E activity
MSGFQTYLLGFIILIVGLAVGAYLLGAPPVWIAVGLIILIGLGIMGATRYDDTTTTRSGPPPP